MSTESPSVTLPFNARVQLNTLGDGLRRWLRLRTLWDRAGDGYADPPVQLEPLVTAIDAAFDDAAAETEAVARFLEANAAAIDAVLDARLAEGVPNCAAPDAARAVLLSPGSERAGPLAARLREWPELRAEEDDLLRGGGGGPGGEAAAAPSAAFCAIGGLLQTLAYAECDQILNPQACAESDKYLQYLVEGGCIDFPDG